MSELLKNRNYAKLVLRAERAGERKREKGRCF